MAILGLSLAQPLSAQANRWLEDLLPRDAAATPLDSDSSFLMSDLLAPATKAEITAVVGTHRTGLGPYALQTQEAVVDIRRPTGIRGIELDFRLSHRMNSRMDFGDGALLPEGSAGFEGGVNGFRDSQIGQWAFRLSGGWNGGGVWQASFEGASSFHQIAAVRWEREDQGLRLTLPSTEVDGTSRTSSEGTGAFAELRWPRGRFLGTALGVEWTRESFDPTQESGTVGLGAVIPITRESTEWRADLRLVRPVIVSVSHRRVRANADGALNQNSQRAGRLFYGRLDSEGWTLALADPGEEGRWRGTVSRGWANGSLSARLETWPFREVWDQLGATAYRVRGDIETHWTAISFDRDPSAVEGWSAGLERAKLTLDGEDWLVTGLGFGRTDQRSLDDFKVTVLLIGGELRFGIPSPSGEAVVHVGGSAPIHADWNHQMDKGSSGPDWAGGWRRWANVNLWLSWSLNPR